MNTCPWQPDKLRTDAQGSPKPHAGFVHLGPVGERALGTPAQLGSNGERNPEKAVDGGHAEAEVVRVGPAKT